MSFLSPPDRESGNWLPNVSACPNRLIPCGNAACADAALMAAQIRAGGSGKVSEIQAHQAAKRAAREARNCGVPDHACPLVQATNTDRFTALALLSSIR